MWIVWKKSTIDRMTVRVCEQICKTKREAERVAKYETKWRGIYGYEFIVEESLLDVVMK